MKICCVIPAFNEKGNLKELIEKLEAFFTKEKIKFFLFFVIQGNDGSSALLSQLKLKHKHIDFICFPVALGIGKAYRVGFKKVAKMPKEYTHILTLDADLNHNPAELPKFLKVAKQTHADIIIGSRFIQGGKFQDKRIWKRAVSTLVNLCITKLLKIPIQDATSGFRLIKRTVVDTLQNTLSENGYPAYMEFILLAHRKKFRMQEVSITYAPRKWGVSKMNTMRTFLDYLFFLPGVFTRF